MVMILLPAVYILGSFVLGLLAGFWIERTRGADLERAAKITAEYHRGLELAETREVAHRTKHM
jgi:hypothetical protein